jgi:hypothetical protein
LELVGRKWATLRVITSGAAEAMPDPNRVTAKINIITTLNFFILFLLIYWVRVEICEQGKEI